MKIGICLGVCLLGVGVGASPAGAAVERIHSELVEAEAGDLVLVQEVVLEAPVARVWRAFTTAEGWMGWAAPLAEVDLRAGGTIRTQYDPDAGLGGEGTNVLHVLNYVPERLLTLRADVSERWPEFMQEDADKLMNVLVFESLEDERTRVLSYGVGYRNLPAYRELLDFFVPANEGLLRKLVDYVEEAEE